MESTDQTPDTWSGDNTYLVHITEETEKQITVMPKANCRYLFVVSGSVTCNLLIHCKQDSNVDIRGIYVGGADAPITSKVQVTLAEPRAQADVHLVSFLKNNSQVEVDGSIEIASDTIGCSGHLLEENVILGERIKLKTLPKLDVRSSDVEASHGARIHKLDEQKLFYMKSRGLEQGQATELLIAGYLNQLFDGYTSDQAEQLRTQTLERIISSA